MPPRLARADPRKPLRLAWKRVLLLTWTFRALAAQRMVEPDGIEPTTSSLQSYALSQLSYGPYPGGDADASRSPEPTMESGGPGKI